MAISVNWLDPTSCLWIDCMGAMLGSQKKWYKTDKGLEGNCIFPIICNVIYSHDILKFMSQKGGMEAGDT